MGALYFILGFIFYTFGAVRLAFNKKLKILSIISVIIGLIFFIASTGVVPTF